MASLHKPEEQMLMPGEVPTLTAPTLTAPALTAPRFYITGRQPLRPGAVVLAIVLAAGVLFLVEFGLVHNGRARLGYGAARAGAADADDKDDDPSQVDTIVLGDPSDAPVPARRGNHVSPVHATILVRLPRFGPEAGLIPDTAAGRLLYGWLAAFNQASSSAMGEAVPTMARGAGVAAEMELRRETGGFSLLSAKEVAPGVLVFRLRDQTPAATEVLGTLEVEAGSSPAAIANLSLRDVGAPGR